MFKDKVLITAALPYSNGSLHFGHIAGVYLPSDVFARFQKLQGKDVVSICGSDEYGVGIELSAAKAGVTPQEQADKYHKINSDLFKALGIDFSFYGRTSARYNAPLVVEFFENLKNNGYMEEKEDEHLFSPDDKRFLADRYVTGICPKCGYDKARGDECTECCASFDAIDLVNPRSALTGAPLERKKSTHWYMRFDLFKKEIAKFFESKKWNSSTLAFAKSYLDNIKPRSMTRDSSWGISVPDREGKVFYVWFDAPIAYLSFTREYLQDDSLFHEYWCNDKTRFVQFLGKDNIPFHAVFFPAMLIGQKKGYNLVDQLVANQFLKMEGEAFSKSSGVKIDVNYFIENFNLDQLRFYLIAVSPETSDSDFVFDDFINRCNKDLLGKFGNFVNRAITFCHKHCEGRVPNRGMLSNVDERFIVDMQALFGDIMSCYDEARPRKALKKIIELASLGNIYFDAKKPWSQVKDNIGDVYTTINLSLNCIKLLAFASNPILIHASRQIWQFLGYDSNINISDVNKDIAEGQPLNMPSLLFSKLEFDMNV